MFFTLFLSLFGASVLYLVYRSFDGRLLSQSQKVASSRQDEGYKASSTPTPSEAYNQIEPLPIFDWEATKPIKIRPFKPKYHLTMGLETIKIDDLIAIDNTYLERINLRRQLMKDHPSATLASRPGSEPMIHEFYIWIFSSYLPSRYPTMYTLSPSNKSPTQLLNTTTSESIPLIPSSPLSALNTLSAHVDTDFLFLAPSPKTHKYHLEAFSTCFPSGFSTAEKLGLPLAAIHAPVPGYAAKLEKSMDRFFASIPVGKVVRRSNWSVITNSELFCESGNHFYDDRDGKEGKHVGGVEEADESRRGKNEKTLDVDSPGLEEDVARQRDEVRIEECRLRCERQTLHRLPETGGLVFAFKTYLYTLEEVKLEGSGEELAAAIQGLGEGSVPEMKFYKRGVVWGDKVIDYLRS